MKSFNLEEALAGKPVVTRDGASVKIAGYNKDAKHHHNIVGWVSGGIVRSWDANGRWDSDGDSNLDLFMYTEKKEIWVNLYRDQQNDIETGVNTYFTKTEAEDCSKDVADMNKWTYIGPFKIEWEE